MQYIYTIEYYLTVKNEIMPYAAAGMDLEIIISKVREIKTNTI